MRNSRPQIRGVKVPIKQLACLLVTLIARGEGKHVQRFDCIPVTECLVYDQYLRAVPRTSAHIDAVRAAHCGFDKFIEKVWCPIVVDSEEEDDQNPGEDTTPNPATPRKPLTRGVTTRLVVPLFPPPDECGKHTEYKILGGEDAGIDEYPWTAMLLYQTKDKPEGGLVAKCGGTLITRRYVLTASHCVTPQLTHVLLGEYDTRNATDCVAHSEDYLQCAPKPLRVGIEQVVSYPQLANQPVYVNDITLLRLAKDVEFNEYVAPVCLPTKTLGYPDLGSIAFAAGWGRWGFTTDSKFAAVKQKVGIPVVSRANCSLSQGITIDDRMLCAGGVKNKDTCQGDSGGPLMQIDVKSTNWNIIGIVSVSTKSCGTEGTPAVYTWLPPFIDWIYESVKY